MPELPPRARPNPWWALAAAALLTLANAAKCPVVDDTAYLLFAEHIAADPLHPYGFEVFWYDRPEPAMGVLAPPVLPYWLALGTAAVGAQWVWLKLSLFPFAWLLCASLASLLRRFAPDAGRLDLLMVVTSPFLAAMLNLMLDVPALALGLAALAVLLGAPERRGPWAWAALAGVLGGLAMQTKYSLLPLPAVLVWGAGCRGRWSLGLVAAAVAAAAFAAWEGFVVAQHGESHFWHHATRAAGEGDAAEKLRQKLALTGPLLAHLGALAAGWAVWLAHGSGWPRLAATVAALATLILGYLLVTGDPPDMALRGWRAVTDAAAPKALTKGMSLTLGPWRALGVALLVGVVAALVLMAIRRRAWETLFLAGWLALEVAGYYALTPFPAGRRVIGIAAVAALIACRHAALGRPRAAPRAWLAAWVLGWGAAWTALDAWDAWPESTLAARADAAIPNERGAVWTQGHWGWQWATHRRGMKLIVPGVSELRPGDYLVQPVPPPDEPFFRPWHGDATFQAEPAALELIAAFEWDDRLRYQTVPALYGGGHPIQGRDAPRLRVEVYRVVEAWRPEAASAMD